MVYVYGWREAIFVSPDVNSGGGRIFCLLRGSILGGIDGRCGRGKIGGAIRLS